MHRLPFKKGIGQKAGMMLLLKNVGVVFGFSMSDYNSLCGGGDV